jgi:N-formylglutamate deformylase
MILHIPHSSTVFPEPVGASNNDINLLTDWFVDELFVHSNSSRVVFPYSRLFCDVERYRDDADEPMAEKGHGVVYRKGATGNVIERSPDDEEAVRVNYYDKHHKEFAKTVREHLTMFPKVVIVDCHSFSDTPLVHEESGFRPDICLGYNEHFELVDELADYFVGKGYDIGFNDPFSGAIVPEEFKDDPRVESILIEVNRSLYLTDKYGKNVEFDFIKDILSGALNIVSKYEVTFDK